MQNPYSLKNKTILITGASSGIGRQCAIICNELGARVILIARNKDRLMETANSLSSPKNALWYSVDLTDYETVGNQLINKIQGFLPLDGIIHAAGISTTLPLKVISVEKLKNFFETNVISAIHLTRILTKKKYFQSSGGSIIFISSVMGVVGEVGKTIYSLTKGALVAGVKSLALELAPRKIRVNSVSPGVVITPMSQSAVYSQNEERLNYIKSLHPLGLGKPEDVAYTCAFLLSDAARWITGTNIMIDGGYTAR